jgi:flagellar protein FlgJ
MDVQPTPRPAGRIIEPVDKNSEEYKVFQGLERSFVLQMVKAMRKSVHEDPAVANTPGHQIFQSWQDEQYAETITQTQGIGLAEMIVRQLHEQEAAARAYRAMQLRPLNKSDVLGK